MNMDQKDHLSLKKTLFFQRSDFAEGFFDRIKGINLWTLLADRFDDFCRNSSGRVAEPIPKIIHQIWIGKSIPKEYEKWIDSWKKVHKDWDYRLWNEKSILAFGLVNERAFRRSRSFGVKSDIARYEILHRLGGIYADTDFECLQSLESLNTKCLFYAGTIFGDWPVINNGLMGAAPGHPLMNKAIEGLSNPVYTKDGMKVLDRSGPGYLSHVFFENLKILTKYDIIFPSSYFYPIPNFVERDILYGEKKRGYIKDWSFAIHYWEASWLKPSAMRLFLSRSKKKTLRLFGIE